MSPIASESHRIAWVDALRAIAALWVLSAHVLISVFGPVVTGGWWKPVAQLAGIGYLGVSLFLVLSGFCLFYPVVARMPKQQWAVPIGRFLWRRWWRIAPPYYAALALLVAGDAFLGGRFHRFDHGSVVGWWGDLLLHVAFLHNLVPGTASNYNAAFWSLALEFQLYLVFPLIVLLSRRIGLAFVALGALGLSVGWSAYLEAVGTGYDNDRGFVLWNAVPARLWDFCCGMVAALVVAEARLKWLAIGVAMVGVPLGFMISMPGVGSIGADVAFRQIQHWIWAPTFAAVVVAGCRIPNGWGWLPALGHWSYSLYLIHTPAIVAVLIVNRKWHFSPAVTSAVAVAASLLAGYVFHRLFEVPFLRNVAPVTQANVAGSDEGIRPTHTEG